MQFTLDKAVYPFNDFRKVSMRPNKRMRLITKEQFLSGYKLVQLQ